MAPGLTLPLNEMSTIERIILVIPNTLVHTNYQLIEANFTLPNKSAILNRAMTDQIMNRNRSYNSLKNIYVQISQQNKQEYQTTTCTGF
jgi:hypothetical protein